MSNYEKKTNNPKMGRPKIDIKEDEFKKLCIIHCTEDEIAGWYHCSIDTINNWCKKVFKQTFSEVYKMLSAEGNISLRRTQFQLAQTNTSMAIWLGKQYLGQKEEINANVESNGALADILDYMKNRDV